MSLPILQRQENLSELWMRRHPDSVARLAEALGAGIARVAMHAAQPSGAKQDYLEKV